ncbi:MAG: sugar phosphate nucleotidyltransferase [Acidimicrobiia bacterium]
MKAIVLVGGEGTRLRPLTLTTPKPLLPIANVPFLERQLRWLERSGVTDVVLSLGYLPEAFRAHFPGSKFGEMRLEYAVEETPLGTAGGIRFAAASVDERVIVCNGDVLTTLDLPALIAFHESRHAEATIALTQVQDPSAFGVVPTDEHGRVLAFIEKPPVATAPSNWINAGTYILEPSVLAGIPEGINVSIERETFPRMLEDQRTLCAMQSDSYWLDIGTPDKYVQAHLDVLHGRLDAAPADDAYEYAPGIWVQGDVVIHPGAHVEGPVLLGHGVEIAAGARVECSVLGAHAAVGPDARVRRSVLLASARVGTRAEADDSICGPESTLGTDVLVADHTVVGPLAEVADGVQLSGGRVEV